MGDTKNLRAKTVAGLLWSFSELVLNQGIQLIIQIILARLLFPKDFGIIGMITIFISISNSIIDCGLSNALIREKEVSKVQYSTIFYFNLILSVSIYVVLYFAAPAIAYFFNEQKLVNILRILSITIIINALGIIQRTMLMRKIDFKSQTQISVMSSVISGVIGVTAALMNFGVYSLVIRSLAMSFLQSFLLFMYNRWIPDLAFDLKEFKKLFRFGWRILVSGLIDTIYVNMYYVVIGKVFTAESLGYYTNANKLKEAASQSITGAVQKVSFPVLSSINNDDSRLKSGYKKIIKNTAFIVFPVMIGLCAVGSPLIKVILGRKWIDSIFYFQILCFEAMLYPIHAINLNILQVKGRADLFLRLEIIKKVVGVSFIVIALYIKSGIEGLLICAVITSYIDYFINAYYSKELINYSIKEQIKDLYPIFLITMVMGAAVYEVGNIVVLPNVLLLVVQILVGIISYIILAKVINSEELKLMFNLLSRSIKKVFNKNGEVTE